MNDIIVVSCETGTRYTYLKKHFNAFKSTAKMVDKVTVKH